MDLSQPVSLTLTIPGDVRFMVTARGVAERVARHLGGSEDEASRIGQAVNTVIAGVIEYAFEGEAGDIEIRFDADGSRLDIHIGYEGESAGRLERALQANGGAFDAMTRVVDRVEFGRAAGLDFCRLTRDFPETT